MRAPLTLGLVLLVAVALTAPAGAQANDPVTAPPSLDSVPEQGRYIEPSFTVAMSVADVPYGQAVNSRGVLETLFLDVYEPAADPAEQFRPVVVWASGGMHGGSKTDVQIVPHLVRRGYVGVSIDYRRRPELPPINDPGVAASAREFVEAIIDARHDMLAAVRWVRANAADLRVDPTRIAVAGQSLGGAVAFSAVFNPEDDGDSGNPGWPSHVAAALITTGAYAPGLTGRPALPGDAPILTMHGTHDTLVPIFASTVPCASTIAVGNVCEHRVYPGAGHGLPTADRAAAAADFFWRHVLTAERTETRLTDLSASGHGGSARVSGRLVTEDGDPLVGQRVLARATAGWAETRTGLDGGFSLTVEAPDHGRSADVLVRYDGHSTGSWLGAPSIAPAHARTTAMWGGPR